MKHPDPRIVAFLAGLLAGCEAPTPAPEPAESSAPDPQVEELRTALAAWERTKDPNIRESIRQACERALQRTDRSHALDAALGIALSNVLLRPDLSIPLLEPLVQGPETPASTLHAWLDAIARTGDLPRLNAEHQRLLGGPLDLTHPAAAAIATQAAADPSTHWTDVRDGVRAARLVEEALAARRLTFDRPIDSIGAAFEAAQILLEGWTITAVAARTRFPNDPLPEVPGVRPAADDRRRIVGFGVYPGPDLALRRAGTALDLDRTARNNTIVLEAVAPRGGRLFLTIEGGWRDGALWLHSANEPERVTAWLAATDALLAARRQSTDEAATAARLRAAYQTHLIQGR
jgi:hypothetical protein